MKNLIIFLSLFLLSSCKSELEFKQLPQGPIKHQLIVAAKTPKSVRARGLKGATPPQTAVYFEVGNFHASTISKLDGSFDIELLDAHHTNSFGLLNFTTPDKKNFAERYEIKNLHEALNLIAGPSLSAPPEISFVATHNNEALILSQEAALLRRIQINGDWTLAKPTRENNILLNPKIKEAPSPQMIEAHNKHALVSFFNAGDVGLINLEANKLINNFKLPYNPPLRSAQSVLALDNQSYLVSFVNFDPAAQDSSKAYGPGVVALVEVNNNLITAAQVLTLPYVNPYAFKISPTNSSDIWVMCTGAFTNKAGEALKTTKAGLIKLTLSSPNNIKVINIAHQIDLPDFVPAQFELVGDNLIIPELGGNRLLVLQENNLKLKPLEANYSRKFNFTLASHWHDDILLLGDESGALVAYSLSEGFFPFPFSEPFYVNKDQQIKFMPSQIIMRHTSENKKLEQDYLPGYGAWVVSHRQNQIIPLDFLKIFGP
jgi:hypothetical protein